MRADSFKGESFPIQDDTEGNIGGQTFANYSANSNAMGTAGVFTESLVTFAPGAIKVDAQVTVSFLFNWTEHPGRL
jgi:hypothetical protein